MVLVVDGLEMAAVQVVIVPTIKAQVAPAATQVTVVINKVYQQPIVVVELVADIIQAHTDLVQVVVLVYTVKALLPQDGGMEAVVKYSVLAKVMVVVVMAVQAANEAGLVRIQLTVLAKVETLTDLAETMVVVARVLVQAGQVQLVMVVLVLCVLFGVQDVHSLLQMQVQ
jgi:hypothetical protein